VRESAPIQGRSLVAGTRTHTSTPFLAVDIKAWVRIGMERKYASVIHNLCSTPAVSSPSMRKVRFLRGS
jgi:hypothetical protein